VLQQAPDLSANAFDKPELANPPIIQIVAIDPDTFAGTTLWSAQDSSEPLAQLTALLRDARSQAATDHTVPAVVDAQLLTTLHLAVGKTSALLPPFCCRFRNHPGAEPAAARCACRHAQSRAYPDDLASTGFNFGRRLAACSWTMRVRRRLCHRDRRHEPAGHGA
jgi:hypothetical protein